MSQERIAVIGGRGKTGGRVMERLRLRGVPAYAASRSTDPGFDWTDRASWPGALAGATAAYVTYQPDLAVPRAADDIAAFAAIAADCGLEHVVLLSGRGEEGAVASEARLRRAPIDHTVLRASWFAQNFSEGAFLDGILAGELALPAGAVPEPFVSVDDVADVAVAALTDPAHRNRTWELTGPRLLTFAEAVAEIAEASGRDIRYLTVPAGPFLAGMRRAGLDEEAVWLLEDLFTRTLDGRNARVEPDIERILGRPAEDFADHARRVAAGGAWRPAQLQPAD
jgi:uncharacterized protein YbjT (DUF2867 family)